MGIENRQAANENFSQGELRQQRKNLLLAYGELITTVQTWITEKQTQAEPENSPGIPEIERERVHAATEALKPLLALLNTAIDVAESDPDNLDAFNAAKRSRDFLYAGYVEAFHSL